MDPCCPLPTKQSQVGLWQLQMPRKPEPEPRESSSLGTGKRRRLREREFKERAPAASQQICRPVICVMGEGVKPHAPDFPKILLSG